MMSPFRGAVKGEAKMEEIKTHTILSSERLGDEKRIQAILVGWGMDAAAIERMLDQHRA
jgi:hypothetical protein